MTSCVALFTPCLMFDKKYLKTLLYYRPLIQEQKYL